MKVTVVWEGGVFRPLDPVHLPERTELEVILPEVEIDEREMTRRRKVGEMHRRLEPIDIRPLTTEGLVREDRESH
jgi:predicted DNA-binding antitoxin AbrB/MazE fold protein